MSSAPSSAMRLTRLLRLLRRWPVVAALVLVLLLIYLMRPPPQRHFDSTTVTRGDVQQTVHANGVVRPIRHVQLGSEVSGQVQAVYATLNARVEKGQELARIDSIALSAAVQHAETEVLAAHAVVDQREAELRRSLQVSDTKERLLERQRALLSKGFVTESALDELVLDASSANNDVRAAKAMLASAHAQLRRAEEGSAEAAAMLARTRIISPISGVVIGKQIEVGQTLTATFQTPMLFEIVGDLKRMQLEIHIDEIDVGKVAAGQAVHFTVDAYPGKELIGEVSSLQRLGRSVEGLTSFLVLAEFDNLDETILPGMTASVRIITGQKHDVLRVPAAALLFSPASDPEARHGMPRISVTSRAEAERIKRQADSPPDSARNRDDSSVWRLTDSTEVPLERLKLTIGLRGDEFVEALGGGLALGDRLALREPK